MQHGANRAFVPSPSAAPKLKKIQQNPRTIDTIGLERTNAPIQLEEEGVCSEKPSDIELTTKMSSTRREGNADFLNTELGTATIYSQKTAEIGNTGEIEIGAKKEIGQRYRNNVLNCQRDGQLRDGEETMSLKA